MTDNERACEIERLLDVVEIESRRAEKSNNLAEVAKAQADAADARVKIAKGDLRRLFDISGCRKGA